VPDLDLELALAGCGRELSYPATPDLVSAVARRLEAVHRPRRTRRRMRVLAFAILLATAGIAAGVTASLHGLGVVFVRKIPPVKPAAGLDLGLRVNPDEARRLAGFKVITPGPPLGKPGAWFVQNVQEARVVTLVWGARRDLPSVRRGVSVLATETPGTVDPGFATKFIGPDAKAVSIRVNGGPGLWITGAPHAISWTSGGTYPHQNIRLVGNVIVWNQGSLLLRIEGARTLAEARRLASSFSSANAEGTG
jgi:hypothetical protein